MENFLGKDYVMVSHEGFESYLEFVGVPYFKRKIALTATPTQTLTRTENGTYCFRVHTAFFTWLHEFTPGVEFDSKDPDGNKLKSVITFDGNVMTHKQTDQKGKKSTHVLEFTPDMTVVTSTVEGSDIVAKRIYKIK